MTAEQHAAWRNALIAEVTAPPTPRHRRIGVTAVATAIAVAAGLVTLQWRPEKPDRAPAMLNAAAQIPTAYPVAGPGQYLRVRTRAEYIGMDGAGNAYRSPELHETFLPADRSQPVIKRTTYFKPTTFFGTGGAALAARDWADIPPRNGTDRPKTTVERDPAEPADEPLPLDPRQLLARLRAAANPAGLPVGEHEFDQLADILRQDGVTAAVRSAAYRALALVPGVIVAADTVVLDGATGTAFAVQNEDGIKSEEIVIDPASGHYLGERLVLSKADGALPAGTVLELTAVTTSVVGAAPHPTVTGTPPVQLGGR